MISQKWMFETRKLTLCSLATVCILSIVLWFFSATPRARLNMMQVVTVTVGAILALRFGRFGPEKAIYDDQTSTSALLSWFGIGLGVTVWTTMLTCYFVSDDFGLLSFSRGPLLTQMKFVFQHGDGNATFYRPLTLTSYVLDYSVWKLTPAGYHVTNLLVHVAAIGGLFTLLRQLGLTQQAAGITAGVFASMPIQVESVAWMSGRFDVLSGTMSLWAAACYAFWRTKHSRFTYSLALMFYALAAFSKETGFVLPLLLVAIELIVFRTWPGLQIAWFLGLGAGISLCRFIALGGIGGYQNASTWEISLKKFEALFIRVPAQLLIGLNWTQPAGILVIVLASVLAAFLLFLALSVQPDAKRASMLLFGAAWMVLSTIPGAFLSMIGPGLSNSRILYLPSAGMAIVLGQLVTGLRLRHLRPAAAVVLFSLLNFGVLHNLSAWRWTSELGKNTLQDITKLVPTPPIDTEFVFSDLPDTVRGVFFFRAGLAESLRMAYNREDIGAVRDSDSPLSGGATKSTMRKLHLVWTGEPGRLVVRQHD